MFLISGTLHVIEPNSHSCNLFVTVNDSFHAIFKSYIQEQTADFTEGHQANGPLLHYGMPCGHPPRL
jgi:hypothetical protein